MRAILAGLLVAALAACSSGSTASGSKPKRSPSPASTPQVYVALGASETAGIGTDDPARDAFPQQLLGRLAPGSVLYDLGIPAETTNAALTDELPAAVAAKPTLVTVFFSVDDLVAGVTPADFGVQLDEMLSALNASGSVRVLVANTPPLDQLPAAAACQSGSSACPVKGVVVPPLSEVRALVQAYNAVIAQVVAKHGATLIDLSGAALVVNQHPEYVSSDGFHPSRYGAAAIAGAFAAALG